MPTVEKKEAELTVGFLAFKESYVSEVTCIPYESVEVRLFLSITALNCACLIVLSMLKSRFFIFHISSNLLPARSRHNLD